MSAIVRIAALLALASASAGAQLRVVPTRFDDYRIYLRPVLESGDTLTLLGDTGGGPTLITGEVAQRNHLTPLRFLKMDDADSVFTTPFPRFRSAFPGLVGPDSASIRVYVGDFSKNDYSWVFPGINGAVGTHWFATRQWIFDYPARRLSYYAGNAPPLPEGPHTISFTTKQMPSPAFPRVRAFIDGDSLDFLFDTGASGKLTPAALAAIGDHGPAARSTSFVLDTIVARWHARHPDWTYIEKAEFGTGATLIRVPQVSIAGYTVGPVWFTTRPAREFASIFNPIMDQPIVGALGGSLLHYFRITADYSQQVALLERP